MQSDDTVWSILNEHFCSFKRKTQDKTLCQYEYNVTGVCSKSTCPIANSSYGTIMEHEGKCYLYLKAVERAHTPKKWWERILLPETLKQGLETIDQHMVNIYSNSQILRVKRKFARMKEIFQRMRSIESNVKTAVAPIRKKTERREASREAYAEIAANVDVNVEEELLRRLHSGTYGDLYHVNEEAEHTLESEDEIEELEKAGRLKFIEDKQEETDVHDGLNSEDSKSGRVIRKRKSTESKETWRKLGNFGYVKQRAGVTRKIQYEEDTLTY